MSTWILIVLAIFVVVTVITFVAVGLATERRHSPRPVGLPGGGSTITRTRRFFAGSVGGVGLVALLAILARGDVRDRAARLLVSSPQPATSAPPTPAAKLSGQPSPAASTPPSGPAGTTPTAGATPSAAPGASPSTPSAASAPTQPAPTAVADRSIPRQPNVLLITIDTTRADRIGANGFAQAHTPNIDRVAAEGTLFTRAYCQLPQTNSSHGALFTSLYPSTTGLKVHMVDKLRPNTQTLASIFGANGYKTAGIYSWVSLDPQFCGLNQGFQTYNGFVVNRSGVFSNSRLEDLAALYRQLKDKVAIVRTADVALGSSSQIEETMDGRADVTAAAVLDWLNSYTGPDPFLLWVHFFDPHYAYTPPAGFDHVLGLDYKGHIDGSIQTIHSIIDGKITVSDDDRARLLELYQGEISFADSQIGQILDTLGQRGLKDDTTVVIASDHGESFGEHGKWTHGLGIDVTDIHVPLVMRYPARIPAGKVVNLPVQLIDVLPTLTEIAGLTVPQPIQGHSLLPLIDGKPATDGLGQAFIELSDESFVSLVAAVGNVTWQIIRNNANGQIELYNLDSDVAERQNVADSQASVLAQLSGQLANLMKVSGVTK